MDSSSLILKSLITVFFIFFAATVPSSVLCNNIDEYEEQFNQCRRKFVCGNFTSISYPFWGGDRPHFCGHPSFKLDCRDHSQNTVINITGLDFRVQSIDQSRSTMIIARLDIWDNSNLCFPNGGIENTTLDYTIFNYPSLLAVQNLTLSYGCPVIQVPEEFRSSVKNFTCGSGGENSENVYYFAYDSVPINLLVCRRTFVVPIFSTGLEKLLHKESGNNEVREVLNEGFEAVYNSNSGACEACERSGGSCGVNSTDDTFLCYCRHKSPDPLYCPHRRSGIHGRMKIIIGQLVASITTVVLIIVFIFCLRRKNLAARFWTKMAKTDKHLEGFIRSYEHLAVQRYRFCDIKKMTLSFQEKLGEGGYGDVYKGKLVDGRLVAVKVLNTTKGNGEEFINEVSSISKTSHINIVTLLGYCLEGSKSALIYEFMPNGSLEKFIYIDNPLKTTPNLGREKLLQIATGIARGLEYLHRGCSTRILHFDIKPHNILLDKDFCPKISDFGLSKLCTRKESIISMMDARGTIGYIAPEVFNRNFGGVSHKSDVYSYGMMILEMVGGSKNIKVGDSRTSTAYFPHWIYKQMELDRNLELHDLVTTEEDEIARKMILVGFWCIQTKPSDRPSMSKVIQMLQGSIEVLQIPPKPFLSSPTSSPEVSFTTTSTL